VNTLSIVGVKIMFELFFLAVPLLAVGAWKGAEASMAGDYQAYVPLDYMDAPLVDLPRTAEQRDAEHLPQNSLWGHKYMQGGAGEGIQMLSPEGLYPNREEVKTDAILPAYCEPPNPCPPNFNSEDGCSDDFENSAEFSRAYQAKQDCMCDEEHMFTCPPNHKKINEYTNSLQTDIEMAAALEQLLDNANIAGHHKGMVAKKGFVKRDKAHHVVKRNAGAKAKVNPYLRGQRRPHIIAKKG